jgi:hypothetical protein
MSKAGRHAVLVRGSLLACIVAVTACGSDDGAGFTGTVSDNGVTVSGIPAPDSALQQLGIVLTVHTDGTIGSCALHIDGAQGAGGYCIGTTFIMGGLALTPGVHTAEFSFSRLSPDSALLLRTTFTFKTVAPKIDRYSADLLPPLAGDDSADAYDMNESGIVVGQSAASDRTTRAVKWVAGVPSALPRQAVAYGTALSINAAGTIAGLLGPSDSATVVWTTGDSIVTVTDTDPPVRINDAGQVLTQVWSRATEPHYGYLLYDVAADTATQVAAPNAPRLVDFNNKGQMVGITSGPYSSYGLPEVWQSGGVTLPGVQPAYAPHGSSTPLDLTDSSKVLLSTDGWVVFGDGNSSTVLEPFFGGGGAERANNNDVVVGIGPDAALYLWRKSANVTEQVDAGAGWTFSSVQKLNDNGAILARGQNSATGQSGSVVLTPIG